MSENERKRYFYIQIGLLVGSLTLFALVVGALFG